MREEVEAFKALAAANVLHGPNKLQDALCFCAAVFFYESRNVAKTFMARNVLFSLF